MLNRNALLIVAGAAFFALDASAAQAQQPTSTRRIPITKETGGEVSTRVDTVTVYRTDTLSLPARVDTVTMTNTVTRVDTVMQQVPMVARIVPGMYLGLGAGAAVPYGAMRSVNQPGPVGQLNLGFQPMHFPIGIRADVNYTHYAHDARYAYLGDRPNMWNGNLDLRLNLPLFQHFLGHSVLVTPYLLGGGSYVSFNNLRMRLDTDNGVTGGVGPENAVIVGGDNSFTTTPMDNTGYHSKFGYNYGGGIAFHSGRKELFAEWRGVHFSEGSMYAGPGWHAPLIFGVNFY
ncbi:MAG TPA: hypothetical protein VHB25_00650 [Gemmatimonadaceae bacterium]|nr:hypothetical protein [Gemmatimonadaceae bacterium]